MIRRTFLDRLFSLLSGFLFLPMKSNAQASKYLTLEANGSSSKVPIILQDGLHYISLVDFAQAGSFGFYTNEEKRKTVLYIGRDKIKFSANNGFILINDRLVQVLFEPFWKNGEIWAAAEILADIMSENTASKMAFDARALIFHIGLKDVNIANTQISKRSDGTLIQIYSSEKFERKNVHLKLVHNWLYVEVSGAKIDTTSLNRKNLDGLVSEIKSVQFDQSASLGFKLRKEVISYDLVMEEGSPDILVNLRTEVPVEAQESEKQKLDDQKKDWRIHTIVLDPGHGGKDPGAIGYNKLYEKNIVLPVALKLGKEIHKRLPEVKVVYTRNTDVFIPLWKRTKIANENNGKLFISLHCNANRNKKVRGFETYFLSAEKDSRARDVVLKENESISFESSSDQVRYEGVNFVLATMAQNAFIKYSQYLATTVQKSLTKRLIGEDMKGRGVKQGPFWVMVGATMPNILIEMGFVSNRYEAKILQRKSTQTKLASAICDGVVKYKTDIESAM